MHMEAIFSSSLMKRVMAAMPSEVEIYLVGGAVRDALLGRDCYDLDFVLPADTLRIARKLADQLDGAYFPLDAEREYARIVLNTNDPGSAEKRIKLDFASYQGETLEGDLRLRDFTINAMAVSLQEPHRLVDPMGGRADLLARRLQVCSPASLSNDPLRILRAVRQALDYDLRITPETIRLMQQTADQLNQVSTERIRDEIFRIFEGKNPRAGLDIMERISALRVVLPEVVSLKGVGQSAPHIYDVWTHTLDVVNRLSQVLAALSEEYVEDASANLMLGLVSMRLGRFRKALDKHLRDKFTPDRSHRALLFLAALYHDSGKPACRTIDEQGKVRFLGHEKESERLVVERVSNLHLSNQEIERIRMIVRHHMRPFLLGQVDILPTRKAVYRFFRDTGAAGVDICILSLADMLAIYGMTLKQEDWEHHLDVVRRLLEAWWEHPQEQVAPPTLLNGNELISALKLEPGPRIGQLLEAIREAQVVGAVNTKEQALQLARQLFEEI